MFDCAAKTFNAGGPLAFYAGYFTFFVRVAPHAMIVSSTQLALRFGHIHVYFIRHLLFLITGIK